MPAFFEQLSPVWQALLAGTFTWFQSYGNTNLATMSTLVGFTVMMCLDVGLG